MNAEKMKYRNIRQFKISAVGYGAMGLSHGYGACPEHKESIRLLKKAFEAGVCPCRVCHSLYEKDYYQNLEY